MVLLILCIELNTKDIQAAAIKTKIVKVNKKYIKLKIYNNRNKCLTPSENFILKKKVKGKWKKLYFKEEARFKKTIFIKPYEKKVVKFVWKNYFKNNLKKGTYKMYFLKNRIFTIKN